MLISELYVKVTAVSMPATSPGYHKQAQVLALCYDSTKRRGERSEAFVAVAGSELEALSWPLLPSIGEDIKIPPSSAADTTGEVGIIRAECKQRRLRQG